jgi:hypothetical protein
MATVAFAPLKEKTCTEISLIGEVLGHYTGDYRLASARHSI